MKSSIKIGRDNTNDVIINEPSISRNHAIVTNLDNNTFEVKDLGSTNGTFVNGQKVFQQVIKPDDKLMVGSIMVDWETAFQTSHGGKAESSIKEEPFAKAKKTITVGSSNDNDIVINDDYVSSHHAKISLLKNGNYYLQDLGSSNGCFVNGARVIAKNFSNTDVVKLFNTDLPNNWFKHKNLQSRFFKEHRKAIIISISAILLITASVLTYFNRCKWLGIDCELSAKQIYTRIQNTLVHIDHEYYYTIVFNGTKYYVGKNKDYTQHIDANTNKQNIVPYGKVSGNGCFIKPDGTILTSPYITNPWLESIEQSKMVQQVIASRTIKGFTSQSSFKICGETARLKWIQNGVVNNEQNYIEANAINECMLADGNTAIMQSIKKALPANTAVANFSFKTNSDQLMNNSPVKYYGYFVLPKYNELIKDTFYMAIDTLNINRFLQTPIPKDLPSMEEGSAVFNNRGELIGIVQRQQVTLLTHFVNQIKD